MKDPRIHNEKHLAFIRTLPCLVTGEQIHGRMREAAHIRYPSPEHGKRLTGKAEKPHDCWTVPLCNAAHREQHSMDEMEFWAKYKIDPLLVAALLWLHTGNEKQATAVVNAAIIGNFPGDYSSWP